MKGENWLCRHKDQRRDSDDVFKFTVKGKWMQWELFKKTIDTIGNWRVQIVSSQNKWKLIYQTLSYDDNICTK